MIEFLFQNRLLVILVIATVLMIRYVYWRRKRMKLPYVNAIAKIESGGIKRGLTAPEAAIVLGNPIAQTFILIGLQLLGKGVLIHKDGRLFDIDLQSSFSHKNGNKSAGEREDSRKIEAQKLSIVLYPYEHFMIELIDQMDESNWLKIDFSVIMRPLISHVANRIGGYDLEQTREYYQAIIRRAPLEARTDGKLISVGEKVIEKNILWILQNDNAETLFEGEYSSYVPKWMDELYRSEVKEKKINFYRWYKKILDQMNITISIIDSVQAVDDSAESVAARLHADISQATFYG